MIFVITLMIFVISLFPIANSNTYKDEQVSFQRQICYFITITTKIFKFDKLLWCLCIGFSHLFFLRSCRPWNKVKANRIATFDLCLKVKTTNSNLHYPFVLISVYGGVQIYLIIYFFTSACNKVTSLHKTQCISVNVL